MAILIGVDVGQKSDPTAVAVVQVDVRKRLDAYGNLVPDTHYIARGLERLPLGTAYHAIGAHVAKRITAVRDRMLAIAVAQTRPPCPQDVRERVMKAAQRGPQVFVDATGVGKPLVDDLRRSVMGVRVVACYFTHGDRRTEVPPSEVRIGKAYLVSRLQSLLQTQRIHLPAGHNEAQVLAQELLNYEIRIDDDGNDKYGAFKVGTHDDLVTALGLAVQADPDRTRIVTLPWA